jgi:hypothetical protein
VRRQPLFILLASLLIVLMSNVIITAISGNDPISSNFALAENTVQHISFDLNSNESVILSGTCEGDIQLLLLQDRNYLYWQMQNIFISLIDANISNSFFHKFEAIVHHNSTFHVLFINHGSATTVTYTINIDQITSSSLRFLPLLFPTSILLTSLLFRKRSVCVPRSQP